MKTSLAKSRVMIVLSMLSGWQSLWLGAAQARNPPRVFRRRPLLRVGRGSVAADVGAGSGVWTSFLLERVGASGHVFATEVKADLVAGILGRHSTARNLSVILANDDTMGLPADCCDAVLLRLVYHAFDKPSAMRHALSRAVRPGGRVLIIDFPGGGRGVKPEDLTADMAASGFERVDYLERWQGQEGVYAIVFRRR